MALAMATVFSSVSLPADAAGLGRLTVQSALGQPLLAEVEITSLTDAEASSLKARLARQEAFRQAGLEFNPALSSLRFDVQRNGDSATVRISSTDPINEPFVDLLVELVWNTGKFVREYTFLLDPPELRVGQQPSAVEGGAITRTVVAPTQAVAPAPAPNSAVAPAAAQIDAVSTGSQGATSNGSTGAAAARAARIAAAYEASKLANVGGAGSTATTTSNNSSGAGQAVEAARNATAASPAPETESQAESDGSGVRVVKQGDTLAGIAGELQADPGSLDKAMVAIYRKNTEAFFGGVHQLKAGTRLVMPSIAEVNAVTAADASREIQASNEAWREYRARLADAAGNAAEAPAPVADSNAAVGGIGEAPAEMRPSGNIDDELKLSRDASGAGNDATSASGQSDAADTEANIARDAALRNAQGRVSELERNVADLQRLLELKNKQLADLGSQVVGLENGRDETGGAPVVSGDVTPPAVAETPAPAVSVDPVQPQVLDTDPAAEAMANAASDEPSVSPLPGVDAVTGAAGEAADKLAEGAQSVAGQVTDATGAAVDAAGNLTQGASDQVNEAADKAAAAAAAAANRAREAARPAPVVKPPESMVDTVINTVTSNPIVPIGVAALIGIGGFFAWRRRKSKGADDGFEDTLGGDDAFAANSLFGTTGGHDVDTNNTLFNTAVVSDTSVDVHTTEVDPIAEAEVYIAYGREAQAEEILKEALKRQPDRQAIRLKLLEIYAGRKDAAAYGSIAREMYDATGGQNEEWPKVITMGLAIDPENPLYTGDGDVATQDDPPSVAPSVAAGAAGLAAAGAATVADNTTDLLNALSADEDESSLMAPADDDMSTLAGGLGDTDMEVPATAEAVQIDSDDDLDGLDFDLDITTEMDTGGDLSRDADTLSAALETNVEMPTLELDNTEIVEPAAIADMDDLSMEIPSIDTLEGQGSLESADADMASIGLDLSADAGEAPIGDGAKWQEMATKLDLASAYEEIGDKEGARELLDEVIKDGDTGQQQKARAMLSKIS